MENATKVLRRGSPQTGAGVHKMCTEKKWFRVAGCAGAGAELKHARLKSNQVRNYENGNGSLSGMRGVRMENGCGIGGWQRDALRLPVAGARERDGRGLSLIHI